MNFTPIARMALLKRARTAREAAADPVNTQIRQLRWLLFRGATTRFGAEHDFAAIMREEDPRASFAAHLPAQDFEYFRPYVMKMVEGERDILWPGICRSFAQSSGTSGGRSKFIPITDDALRLNHYAGASDAVALYLEAHPESRMFSGKGLILGGSFESEMKSPDPRVHIGDLSATLIDRINPLVNLFRVPDKKTALLSDWTVKLDAIARKAVGENITNLSGVPSWFLKVLHRALEISGKSTLPEIWPNLEVFFHGGISFLPYRRTYDELAGGPGILNYWENYNASEGFFAAQHSPESTDMMMLLHNAAYYEFLPLGASETVAIENLKPGKVYELIITAPNGLYRYRIGDTVRVESTEPLSITIAGRTKSFINAFGEELMEDNAEKAVAEASRLTGASVENYHAEPRYPDGVRKGRHVWYFEWITPPDDLRKFTDTLDSSLKRLNSDYAAKRAGGLFMDPPEIIELPAGFFDRWLATHGSGKLGGQRKIPRLSNTPILENDNTII